jgi:hypothetical protein
LAISLSIRIKSQPKAKATEKADWRIFQFNGFILRDAAQERGSSG